MQLYPKIFLSKSHENTSLYVDTLFSRIKHQLSFCYVKMCVLVTWIGCIFYITNFLWQDTLYLVLILSLKELLSPQNVSCWFCLHYCSVALHLVFQVSCFIGKFVYFVSPILPSLFLVQSIAYYLFQCIFLLSMWFTLLLPRLSWHTLFTQFSSLYVDKISDFFFQNFIKLKGHIHVMPYNKYYIQKE